MALGLVWEARWGSGMGCQGETEAIVFEISNEISNEISKGLKDGLGDHLILTFLV
jgi:hypothetical protein